MTVARRRAADGTFRDAVHRIVRQIPRGRVCTYGDVARLAGRPGAARAVGRLMAEGAIPGLPYHRVIGAGGAIGGYGSGIAFKAALLAAEGVTVRRGRVVDFARLRWSASQGNATRRRPV